MSSKKYKNKICVYCRESIASTADHVFPREIFQEHQRGNLPKVPACKSCNNEKSRLEHYLLSVLPFGATHGNAHQALSVDVIRRLERNRKLHRKIKAGFGYSYIPRQSKILEKRLSITLNSNALHDFVGYVARGLMWHHCERLLPLDCTFRAFTPSPRGLDHVTALFALNSPHRVQVNLGENTVRYKGVMSEVDEGVSVWAVQLFGGITLSTRNHSHIFENSFVAVITGKPSILNKLEFENGI
ncbi:MAG: HNH endonuclease [Methylomicrobium sp.]